MTTRYRTIVADPPWAYARSGVQGSVDAIYPTMAQGDIAGLGAQVSALADDNCHLYLWATTPKLWDEPNPARIAEAWGFTYKTLITWVKGERVGIGWYYRVDTEHCLFCTRGSAPIPGELRQSNVLWSPRGDHSAKPEAFLDLVERVSPGPYLEMFSRRARFGWQTWGNESLHGGEAA